MEVNKVDKAKKLLEEEQQARIKRCNEKIAKALEEEKCKLDVAVIVGTRGIQPITNIVAV